MTTNMTSKAAFLEQVRSDWSDWQETLAGVPEDRVIEPGAAGFWTVKDLIAHIAVYERWTIEWLAPALEGNEPEWDYPDGEEFRTIDERNARFYEENRDRSLADIRAEAADIHAQLMSLLDRIPEDSHAVDIRDYQPEVGLYYEEGTTILGAIDGNTAEHYRHHIADVQAWLKSGAGVS